jgi:hypothetical protein
VSQTVSHWHLTAEAWDLDSWQWGRLFSDDLEVFVCNYHSTIDAYSSTSTCWSYQKDKGQDLETIQKAMLGGNWEDQINNYYYFLISLTLCRPKRTKA